MKRKNLYTNILNIIAQILALTWYILETNDNLYIYKIVIMRSGFIAIFSTYVFLTITAIINIIVGIKNRKESKPCLVIYEIIAVMYILEQILAIYCLDYTEDIVYIILAVIYIIICVLTIVQFILNRKVKKTENKRKFEIIIYVITIIIGIIAILLPLGVKKSVETKIKKAMEETNGKINNAKVYGKISNENKYNFLEDNGNILFTIDAKYVEGCTVIRDKDKEMKITLIKNGNENKLLDISDENNIKTILTCKECDIIDRSSVYDFAIMSNLNNSSTIEEGEEEKTNNLIKLEEEEANVFSEYENNQISQNVEENTSLLNGQKTKNYTYYSNGNIAIQVVEPRNLESINTQSQQNENQTQTEYYLINLNNNQKQQISCDRLIYDYDYENDSYFIQLFEEKYLTYFRENMSGFLNIETGETLEIPNDYVFLDVNDETAVIAIVNDRDKGRKISDDEYNEDMKIVVIDRNLSILSEEYNNLEIFNNFYLFKKGELEEYTAITNKNKIIFKDEEIDEVYGEGIIVVRNEDGKYNIYNENGKANEEYDSLYSKYAGIISQGYVSKNGYDVYKNIVSQIK